MRTIIGLECTKCKNKNYSTTKNKNRTPDKLVMKKFCPKPVAGRLGTSGRRAARPGEPPAPASRPRERGE